MRVFVVWERVLTTDWAAPSNTTLGRIPDLRASQYWDPGRVLSHAMGEHDRRSRVWDYIAIYPPGAIWDGRPPAALYHGNPVVRVQDAARQALAAALDGVPAAAQVLY